jgi:hypothetical protein
MTDSRTRCTKDINEIQMKMKSNRYPIKTVSLFCAFLFCRCLLFAIPGYLGAAQNLSSSVTAKYTDWKHSKPLFILTTPEGADLPATAVVKDFPLLVRLHKGIFDFSQATSDGSDLRFSNSRGEPLSYQIEQWNPVLDKASIWIRIPEIHGNSRQEIRMYWGNSKALSESKGSAVFHSENGYVAVFHMNEGTKEETGNLNPQDTGTLATSGMIGGARHFSGGKGIFCGDKIKEFPSGSSSSTTQAWFRSTVSNARVFGWGNEAPQGKVIMNYRSPPHARMECYFSGADVAGETPIPKGEWVHVLNTYQKGESKLYVNGILDGITKTDSAPLKILTPSRMWIGGWYDVYDFEGDVDEVRLSNVVRSPEWAKLEYENQKVLQTLVGHPVRMGESFAIFPEQANVNEGETITFSANANGARKIYWILKRGDKEEIVGIDDFQYTFATGRVDGDQKFTLRIKAVYPTEIKTRDIPILIKEYLPEPIFTLKAPAKWNGRDEIEVETMVSNHANMSSKGVGKLDYQWATSGLAIIREISPGKLILKRSQNSGDLFITASVANGGAPVNKIIRIPVSEPEKDPWVARVPSGDEKPVNNQFFARGGDDKGTLYYKGKLSKNADEVFLKLYTDGVLTQSETQKPAADGAYFFGVKLNAGLVKYKVEFGTRIGNKESVHATADNLVCGDAYLIEGQSNAVSTDWGNQGNEFSSDWIRSFGSMNGDIAKAWGNAVRRKGENWEIGYWGMDLARHLLESQKVPICIINGAVGGTRIDQHLPNPNDRTDKNTIYGRHLNRIRHAGLTHGIRGVLWHQGEADQGADGPDGGFGCETYTKYFEEMSAAWKKDMPNIQHYYLFQIWPNACSQGGTRHSDQLREYQRLLPRQYSRMSVMSTLGIKPEGPCHYPAAGYERMAQLIAPLVEQGNYGKTFKTPISAPDLKKVTIANDQKEEILLEFDQQMTWDDKSSDQIFLNGNPGKVKSGKASGNTIRLFLAPGTDPKTITYIVDKNWNPNHLIYGANDIAALTFYGVQVQKMEIKK